MANKELDETSVRLIRAVKAEAARIGVTGQELAEKALHRKRAYVYDRYNFKQPFTTNDLALIANYLHITVDDIIRTAAADPQLNEKAA